MSGVQRSQEIIFMSGARGVFAVEGSHVELQQRTIHDWRLLLREGQEFMSTRAVSDSLMRIGSSANVFLSVSEIGLFARTVDTNSGLTKRNQGDNKGNLDECDFIYLVIREEVFSC